MPPVLSVLSAILKTWSFSYFEVAHWPPEEYLYSAATSKEACMAQCEGTLLQAVHDMEEWTCPLCTRRRGGLRSAALRSAPAKLEPAVVADGRASRDEATASPTEVPRAARDRQMGADGALAPPGLKLRLPAAKEVRSNFSLQGRSTARSKESTHCSWGFHWHVCF